MDDLISRQAALEKVRTMQTYKLSEGDDMILVDKTDVQTELMMLPPVQPEVLACGNGELVAQPEAHEGHWILYDKRFPWRTWYKCSECGNYLDFSGVNGGRGEANYCPNCGARMTASTK